MMGGVILLVLCYWDVLHAVDKATVDYEASFGHELHQTTSFAKQGFGQTKLRQTPTAPHIKRCDIVEEVFSCQSHSCGAHEVRSLQEEARAGFRVSGPAATRGTQVSQAYLACHRGSEANVEFWVPPTQKY